MKQTIRFISFAALNRFEQRRPQRSNSRSDHGQFFARCHHTHREWIVAVYAVAASRRSAAPERRGRALSRRDCR
jgi:hypothetical protein